MSASHNVATLHHAECVLFHHFIYGVSNTHTCWCPYLSRSVVSFGIISSCLKSHFCHFLQSGCVGEARWAHWRLLLGLRFLQGSVCVFLPHRLWQEVCGLPYAPSLCSLSFASGCSAGFLFICGEQTDYSNTSNIIFPCAWSLWVSWLCAFKVFLQFGNRLAIIS